MADPMEVDSSPGNSITALSRLRRHSAVLAGYPWLTDVIVNGCKLQTFFDDDDFLMPLAKRLDRFFLRLDTEYNQELVELKSLLEEDPTKPRVIPSRNTIVQASSLLVSLRILDIAVKIKGVRSDVDVLKHAKVKRDKGPNRSWDKFGDWTQILRECRNSLNAFSNVVTPEATDHPGNNMLALLRQSFDLQRTDAATNICKNFYLTAASIAILVGGPKNEEDSSLPEIPEKARLFFNAMIDNVIYTDSDAMDTDTDSRAMDVDAHLTQDLPKNHNMRSVLSLAGLVSPLYLLTPIQLMSTSCGKYELVMLSKSLGNLRPPLLEEVEMKLWKGIFDVARGQQSPFRALQTALGDIDWPAVNASQHRSWFLSASKDVPLRSLSHIEPDSAVPNDWTLAKLDITLPQTEPTNDDQGGPSSSGAASTDGPQDHTLNTVNASTTTNDDQAGAGDVGPTSTSGPQGSPPDQTPVDASSSGSNGTVENGTTGTNANTEEGDQNGKRKRITLLPPAAPPAKPPKNNNNPRPKTKATPTKTKKKSEKSVRQRYLTVPPDDKIYRDHRPPMMAIRAQSLQAKYTEIDINVIAGPRTKLQLKEVTAARYPHPDKEFFVAYTARGDAVEIRPRLHTVKEVKALYDLVDGVVETTYHEGKPKFISRPEDSVFKLMSYTDFNASSTKELLSTIRDKVIILSGCPITIPGFDEDGLSELRDLDATISVQDKSIRVKNGSYQTQTVHGSLQQVLNESRKPDGKILNALDLPMGINGAYPTPLSSERMAWMSTEGLPYCKDEDFPSDHLRWALAATEGAFHPWHIDNVGAASFIGVQCGGKLLFIGTPREKTPSSLDLFLEKFDVNSPCKNEWNVEAILLQPGDQIVFPPNTRHAVYTSKPSICLGGHMYPTSTLTDTLIAHIHAFILTSFITNTELILRRDLHHRMMVFLHYTLVDGKTPQAAKVRAHIPVLSDFRSVVNVLSGCALSIFMNALSTETYKYHIPKKGDDCDKKSQEYRYSVWDLNALSALERKRCIDARSLAWKVTYWIKAHYRFYRKIPVADSETVATDDSPSIERASETEELDFYDDILVPFLGHLSVAISAYRDLAAKASVRTARTIPHTNLTAQLAACFTHNPEIASWMALNAKDDPTDLLYNFDNDIEVEMYDQSDAKEMESGPECSGETSLDLKYNEGMANDWLLFDPDDLLDSEEEDTSADNEAPTRKKRRTDS